MSYILDALRRAEDDRRKAQGSPLDQITTSQHMPMPSPRRVNLIQGIALVVVACVVLAAAIWWWYRHGTHRLDDHPVTSEPALIPAGQAPQLQSPPQPRPANVVGQVAPPPPAAPVQPPPQENPIEGADRLSSLDDLMPPKPAPQPAPRQIAPHQRAESPPAPNAAQLAPSTEPGNADTTSPISTTPLPSTSSTALHPAITAAVDANPRSPDDAQKLKAMPDSYRAEFPQITVQVHVYDNDPAKRWSLIDGKRYREGDALPQGPKIYKIVPQGIVFDWQGQRVLYPVGS